MPSLGRMTRRSTRWGILVGALLAGVSAFAADSLTTSPAARDSLNPSAHDPTIRWRFDTHG